MITAKIIKDSISEIGKRIITFELEYPRFIHSEMMTHRVFSRNSASSRAIPISKMISLVWNNCAEPCHWGKNQPGMQAQQELIGIRKWLAKKVWKISGKISCIFAWLLYKIGVHKQIANRVLEPWGHIKVIVTSTEWDNFFELRNHPDAQPEIHELALKMYTEMVLSKPKILKMGQWHIPYVDSILDYGKQNFYINCQEIDLEKALKIGASMCAQVSYRLIDNSLEKALKIYDRLVASKPAHLSPFEHSATPMSDIEGISGNFRGWAQYRQTLKI
jgi:thymidylate synthase ThyX